VAIVLAGYVGTASSARAQTDGEVVAEFEGVPATFSGGEPGFSVVYDIQIVVLPNGTRIAIFNQRDSDDVLRGKINETGIPPVLTNPGKEKMTGGRMKDDRTLTYGYYEWVSQGQTYTWSSVVFDFPSGALPFPAPITVGGEEDETVTPPPEEEEQGPATSAPEAPAQDEGGIPVGPVVAIAGVIAALAGVTLFYTRRNRRGGCDEEYARWRAAQALYDEAMEAEEEAEREERERKVYLDRSVSIRDRAVAKPEVEAKVLEYDAQVVAQWAELDAAKEAHEAATERRKELGAGEDEAKRIYDECTGILHR
jgi:hypothetical protein